VEMEMALIAHRCGRGYGPDSSRRALRAALAGGPLRGVETTCASRATARWPARTTPTCRSRPRSLGGRTSGEPPTCWGRAIIGAKSNA
jgi:hypothetical protein